MAVALQYYQAGIPDQAEQIVRQVVAIAPGHAEAWCVLGVACQVQGRIDEAVTHYQQALQLAPSYIDALNNLGVAFQEQAKWEEAERCHRQALAVNPQFAAAYLNLGIALIRQEKNQEAITVLQQAVRLNPHSPEAFFNLGNAYHGANQAQEAASSLNRALQLRPDYAEAHNNLGFIYSEQQMLAEAVQHLRRAVSLKPEYAEAHFNLGNALAGLGILEESRTCLQETLRLRPDFVDALNSLGVVNRELGDLDEALKCYERALRLKPDYAEGHHNQAQARLLSGNFDQGWAGHEWRWKCKIFPRRDFKQPLWDGSCLEGQTILLHAEQGMGDTLQFIRYAPLVQSRGGKVIVECADALLSLLARSRGIDHVVAKGSALPPFDLHAPLLSLPNIFKTSRDTVPAAIPYVFPDDSLVESWRRELGPLPGFKIGITWQGNPRHRWDFKRSVRLSCFVPLAHLKGIQLFSLQKGPGSELLAQAIEGIQVTDLSNRMKNFMDTAAILKNLDLVITIDTAIAHCAGAMGLPVWVALPVAPDWRWLMSGEKSMWYPTMRLFRQTRLGQWEDVFQRMAEEVEKLV